MDLPEQTDVPDTELLEPLDDWVHLQPSLDEERRGRIYLPVGMGSGRLERSVVLGAGSGVSGVDPGDVVLALAAEGLELRDGSKLVRREHLVARIQG